MPKIRSVKCVKGKEFETEEVVCCLLGAARGEDRLFLEASSRFRPGKTLTNELWK